MTEPREELDALLRRADELDRANAALRARNAEIEAQLAPKPVDEAEANRARLASAIDRERAEAEAQERARRDEAELRALAKARKTAAIAQRKEARSLTLMFAIIGSVTAAATGSGIAAGVIAGIAVLVAVALTPWGAVDDE